MISGSLAYYTNEAGEEVEDFVAGDIVQMPKRTFLDGDPNSVAYRKRLDKLEAIVLLKRAGWPTDRIARAIDYTPRNVRKKLDLIGEIASKYGRV
jgi:hypothetical protein